MEKKVVKKTAAKRKVDEPIEIVLKAGEVATAVSPVKKLVAKTIKTVKTVNKTAKKSALDVTTEIANTDPKVELSPVFKALAEPTLPTLKRENRARLQMQTPTRLYFYWSVKENPYHILKQTFGDDTGSYSLILKITNLRRDSEEIQPAEAEGNWWFDVEPDGEYQAEIGFYAPNRPYFRIIHSNTVETPRRSPSPRVATDADWKVSASKFAEVLEVAGFSQDAFDVTLAGDDHIAAENVTHTAFYRFVGSGDYELHGLAAEDIRYAMLALASGATLEDLRWKISPTLFAILQANTERLAADNALAALGEYFDIDEAELNYEQLGAAVYGASLVNFPRTLKTRRVSSRYTPVSSPVGLGR